MEQAIIPNIDLADYSGIRVGGKAAWFSVVTNQKELQQVIRFAHSNKTTIVPLGSGTNMLFGSGKLNVLVLKNELQGREVVSETDEYVDIKVASGENWDGIVAWTVENEWNGIEALSAIPGTVGAAPVQNIGAYGQEISNVITKVETINLKTGITNFFSNAECQFSYRDSIFKKNRGAHFITSVTMRLTKKNHPGIPPYEAAQKYFDEKGINNPSLQQIRGGITDIRWSKLPRPEILPNCGSWFKNPILPKDSILTFVRMLEQLGLVLGDVPHWQVGDNQIKLAAGWLVEHTVGKDYDNGYFATYGKNALVLVNHSLSSSAKKFLKFESHIINQVHEKFGITLEREPVLIQ